MFGKSRERSPYFLVAIDFGYTLLASLGVFGYAGYWLDGRYRTTPVFLIGGIFLGLAVGFSSLFRKLNTLEAARRAAQEREKAKRPPEPKP